ncbi:bile acid:sodium symporter [Verrucomicrobia bacterium]|nr:bile acid:sodium symporter [Verrucomicrobiota bacterium]
MLVAVVLPIVLAFIMFSLGLGLKGEDFARVFQQPKVFAVGLLNQLVLLPLVAFGLVLAFDLPPILAVGTMILALCPGGVTSNMLTRLANGAPPLSISLTAVASLLSVLIVPWVIAWSIGHFNIQQSREVDVTTMGIQMFLLTAVPVVIGMVLTAKAPDLVQKISKTVSHIALVLFIIIVVLAIKANWAGLMKYFPTLGPALLALMIIMLALGLISGKLLRVTSKEATTISLESGIQNATLGLFVAKFVGEPALANELSDAALPSSFGAERFTKESDHNRNEVGPIEKEH